MKRTLTMVMIVALLAGGALLIDAPASAKPDKPIIQTKRIAEAMRGSWDFSQSPYRHVSLLRLRQEDNRFPNYLSGQNDGKRLTINAHPDMLSDELMVKMDGAIVVRLTNAPAQPGTEQYKPAGQWGGQLDEKPVVFRITKLTDIEATGTWSGKEDKGLKIEANFAGTMSVGEQQAPISGKADFQFSEMQPRFAVAFTFTLTDAALKLTGPTGNGKPIQATLYTRSVASDERPAPAVDELDLDLLD